MAAPAANCHCSSRDKTILPSPQLAWGQGKPPRLPKPPKIHMKAISWTSVRDWTPSCSRSVHRFPKPNYFPWLRQHATTWLVIFFFPRDVSQHSKPAGANSKILTPFKTTLQLFFPWGFTTTKSTKCAITKPKKVINLLPVRTFTSKASFNILNSETQS